MTQIANERHYFLGRLKQSPVFLAAHFSSLSRAVFRKLKNRVRTQIFGQQHGAKEWPKWLGHRSLYPREKSFGTELGLHLPIYPDPIDPWRNDATGDFHRPNTLSDPESCFARHRWGFLLDALIYGKGEGEDPFAQVKTWIEQNSDKQDSAWEIYSACERVANLLVYLTVANASLPVSVRCDPILCAFIEDSIGWIAGHVEYYGPLGTNNHIINNARALIMGGAAMSDENVIATGMQILRNCLPQMVLANGFLRERSSHYQLIVLSWVLDAAHFVAASRVERNDDTRFLCDFAERMASAAGLVCDRDGYLEVLIGDVSPDMNPRTSALRLRRLYPAYWPVASAYRPLSIQDGWFRISLGEDQVVGNFPSETFPPPFPTHGHADYTSFVWNHDGVEILADTGRYSYVDEPVSRFQQSASGHNVPLVNGFSPVSNSLVANGRWWPLPYAIAKLQLSPLGAGVQLEHDGYARATPVLSHVRKIIPSPGRVTVIDSFSGHGIIELTLCWNFGSGFEDFDMDAHMASGPVGKVRLTTDGINVPPTVTWLSGSRPGGWQSRSYGEVHSSLGIGFSWPVALPAEISTRFEYTKCVE